MQSLIAFVNKVVGGGPVTGKWRTIDANEVKSVVNANAIDAQSQLDDKADVVSAPAGGSGVIVSEYASTPLAPPVGYHWVERVDATTVKLCYYDGIDTYSVQATV